MLITKCVGVCEIEGECESPSEYSACVCECVCDRMGELLKERKVVAYI